MARTESILGVNNTFTGQNLFGATASLTDFPNAQLISSQSNTGYTSTDRIGFIGEATTSGTTVGKGVLGVGGVNNTADTAMSIGVKGVSISTHSGGINTALYGRASGSGIGNYALYMEAGNIFSATAQRWTIASGLTVAGTHKVDIGIDAIHYEMQNGGLSRFKTYLTGTESGSNAGGHYRISAYTDAGTFLNECLTISRLGGYLNLGNGVSPGVRINAAGTIRATDTTLPTAGTGVEMYYNIGGVLGLLLCYDRTASAYKDLLINGQLFLSSTVSTSIGKGSAAVASALLELTSTTRGFLPPVMTTTQKNAITTPATGLVVFDSTLAKLCVFSTTWQTITSA